jgi:molybdenum cofactor biosynthesis protein B
MSQASAEFIPTRIAILTVSSRRGEEDDTSGHWLRDAAQEAGHRIVDKAIVKENRYAIRAQVSAWIASDEVQVVLITGGTGFTDGDQAPEALRRCLTVKSKGLAKFSACSPSKKSAPRRCNPAPLPGWRIAR